MPESCEEPEAAASLPVEDVRTEDHAEDELPDGQREEELLLPCTPKHFLLAKRVFLWPKQSLLAKTKCIGPMIGIGQNSVFENWIICFRCFG